MDEPVVRRSSSAEEIETTCPGKDEVLLLVGDLKIDRQLVEIDLSASAAAAAAAAAAADDDDDDNVNEEGECEIVKRMISSENRPSSDRPSQRASPKRDFDESRTKLCIVSDRVKEYFESIKGKNNETLHLYQLFKSVRTELVACLLVSLIHSKSLIVSNSFIQRPLNLPINNNLTLALANINKKENNDQQQLSAHLFVALINSFAVATMVQIFGHISGCHLIPSISIALYIKSHITRLRLILYLLAQFIGSLIAIALLVLLTSSQISLNNLNSNSGSSNNNNNNTSNETILPAQHSGSWREKRQAFIGNFKPEVGSEQLQNETPPLTSEPSEAILLSIMEQQFEEKRRRRLPDWIQRESQKDSKAIESTTTAATITTTMEPESKIMSQHRETNSLRELANESKKQEIVDRLSGNTFEAETRNLSAAEQFNDTKPHNGNSSVVGKVGAKKKVTRKRRSKVGASAKAKLAMENFYNQEETRINLLELALPEEIMSSESIVKCLENSPRKTKSSCLSLSNGSQMFIFQLIATMLINLTHLVNVDPRRIDTGFKSLSIGLSYFVAQTLAIQSGGFYGNPFELIFLNAFSTTNTTSGWRAEWFIYLVVPLIGGFLSALSHDYIDFRGYGKQKQEGQLYLRRSFTNLYNVKVTSDKDNDVKKIITNSSSPIESQHNFNIGMSSLEKSPKSRPNSYSRQVKLERQRYLREQEAAHIRCSPVRRSDFDPNFLISSSSVSNSNSASSSLSAANDQIAMNKLKPSKDCCGINGTTTINGT